MSLVDTALINEITKRTIIIYFSLRVYSLLIETY